MCLQINCSKLKTFGDMSVVQSYVSNIYTTALNIFKKVIWLLVIKVSEVWVTSLIDYYFLSLDKML